MALINLLPSSKKQLRPAKILKGTAAKIAFKAPKKLLFIPAAIFLLLILGWAALFIQVKNHEKTLSLLNKELIDLKSSNKQTDYLNKRMAELNNKLSFYKKMIGEESSWSKLLSFINEAKPYSVWLTSIYTQTDPKRALVITGSATSIMESKIIVSVSRFANRLKNYPYFSKNFEEIKLGPISLERKGGLNVMNFSLSCRFKP